MIQSSAAEGFGGANTGGRHRSLRAIAAELNKRAIRTPREWQAGNVGQLLTRLLGAHGQRNAVKTAPPSQATAAREDGCPTPERAQFDL